MAASLKGDFARLWALTKQIEKLGSPEFVELAGKRSVATAKKLVADSFREERDPYGNAWAPLEYRKGKILRDTGRLAASFSGNPRPGGFEFGTSVVYAGPHQYGARIAAHSRLGGMAAFDNRGRFISRKKLSKRHQATVTGTFVKKRLTLAIRVRFFGGYTRAEMEIPKRQMVPEESTGGMGPIWGAAMNLMAERAMEDWLKRAR